MLLVRLRRSRSSLFATLLLLPLILTVGPSANAFPGEGLFNKLAALLVKAGVEPDAIELTRYSLNEPTKASSVYAHAASQDYAFFALVGAVKAAKGQTIPGIGTFNKSICNSPVTVIDLVFGKADSFVDNAQGKQQTNVVVDAAKQYAADYVKASTAEAKEEVKAELAANIPYFGEIETICSFGLDTNLTIEATAINQAREKANSIRRTYSALQDGDVVTGVVELFKLGADKQMACSFIDNAVSGGVISRTPVLGSLAKGACTGFFGSVFDGATGFVKGGVGLVEEGVSYLWSAGKEGACEIYSWFGNGCAKAPVLGPNSRNYAGAQAWCAPFGGFQAGKFDGPNWSFSCNDGSVCAVKTGRPVACKIQAEYLAWQAQQRRLIQADFDKKLPTWQKDFAARWQSQCPLGNSQCRNQIAGLQVSTSIAVKGTHAASPDSTYVEIANPRFAEAEAKAADLIENEKFRVLPPAWKASWDAEWARKCPDAQCRDLALTSSTVILQAVAQQRKQKPGLTYGALSWLFAGAAKGMQEEYRSALVRVGRSTTGPGTPPAGPIRLRPRPLPPVKPPGN